MRRRAGPHRLVGAENHADRSWHPETTARALNPDAALTEAGNS
jgi:hypothetical protein